MKKIGLVTWFSYNNYGSVLQAFALQTKIDELGYDCELINLLPKNQLPLTTKSHRKISESIKSKLLSHTYSSEQLQNYFNSFRKDYLKISDLKSGWVDLINTNKIYSAVVCGSDQVWGPRGFDERYFLSFVNDDKKIAYAPSIGQYNISDSFAKEKMGDLISKFKYLSTREEQGAKIIKEITGKEAKIVLDPTLLLNKNEWEKAINIKDTNEKKKYVLCYFLGNYSPYRNQILKFAKENDLEIKLIPTFENHLKLDETMEDVSPKEFVSLIRNASFVMTDSFHGTAFSINFNVPFYVFPRFKNNSNNNQNSRIESILSLLNLKDRYITKVPKSNLKIDYDYANKKIEEERIKSINFLTNSLSKASESIYIENCKNILDSKLKCTSCGVCHAVCPKNCISMRFDDKGFYRPYIDNTQCIECGICRKNCPALNNDNSVSINSLDHLYSFKSKEEAVLKTSASGGAGYVIASTLIKDGYYIVGCTYDYKNRIAKHIVVEPNKISDLSKIQSSKYIQSDTSSAFKEVMELLKKGNKVAVFGLPCQIAGLYNATNKWRDSIVLIDLICHGTPSHLMYENYLKYVDSKRKTGSTPQVNFRCKDVSWRGENVKIQANSNVYFSGWSKNDLFYFFFNSQTIFNESCYECSFRESSYADIRIGDYWGPRFENDLTGVSMTIPFTEKGKLLLSKLDGTINEYGIDEYCKVQYPFNPAKPLFYESQLNDFENNIPLGKIRNKYFYKEPMLEKNLKKLYRKIRK